MKLSLVVRAAGKLEGQAIEIKVPQFVIGRDPQCQLRPASPMISKRHCALIEKDGKYYLKDFGSTNGSFVNGNQVTNNAVELKNGDKLKIGPLQFDVRLEAGDPLRQQTPVPRDAAKPGVAKPGVAKPGIARPGTAKQTVPDEGPSLVPAGTSPDDTTRGELGSSDGDTSVDDDIAAMLLSGSDETANDTPAARDPIPQGTTVFEMPVPPQPGPGPAKAEDKEKDKKKPAPVASTASAAADILEKMRKRPRG